MLDPGRASQCPFLNRADARCSRYFNLDGVVHVFAHCLDEYRACATFGELMAERKLRTPADGEESPHAHAAIGRKDRWNEDARLRGRVIPLVQVALPRRDAKPLLRAS